MLELIDKQAFMKALCDGCFKSRAVDIELKCTGRCNVTDILQQQPTIEAVQVKHGHWIFGSTNTSSWMKCSECLKSQSGQTATFSYCPNCGASMDEKMPEVRLIDANAFSEQYGNYYAEQGPEEGFIGTVGELIAKQPTIEPEVRHGEWVETEPDEDDRKIGIEFSIKCSRCHDENSHLDFNENHEITGKTFWKSRFCPNCGAKMYADGGTISKEQFAEIMGGIDNV